MAQPQGEELARVRATPGRTARALPGPLADRPPTTVRGVHHLALICKDAEETIKFYQELLGFPLVELVENRDYAGSNHFFFDIGNGNLLGFFDFPGHEHPAWQETIGGVQHLAISVTADQFEAAKKRLDEAGHRLPRPRPRRGRQHVLPRPQRRRPGALPRGARQVRGRATAALAVARPVG